jgi:hypothetical protein
MKILNVIFVSFQDKCLTAGNIPSNSTDVQIAAIEINIDILHSIVFLGSNYNVY